ncbi:MAG TPA: hypothetical protein VET85_17345 [Stellaceae bacterium]|nr:hypothetical protein [Stellaceae bacterium]
MAKARILVGAALVLVSVFTKGGDAADYSFRGVPVGMPLDEFRRLPHPDRTTDPTVSNSRVLCTGEADRPTNTLLDVYGADAALHVKICGYFTVLKTGIGAPVYFQDSVTLGTLHGSPAFVFFPDSERGGAYRLMQIVMGGPSNQFDAMVHAYTERFGRPASLAEVPAVESWSGRKYPNMEAVWLGGETEIRVVKRSRGIDHMEIKYFELRLFARYAGAKEKLDGKPGDKL